MTLNIKVMIHSSAQYKKGKINVWNCDKYDEMQLFLQSLKTFGGEGSEPP